MNPDTIEEDQRRRLEMNRKLNAVVIAALLVVCSVSVAWADKTSDQLVKEAKAAIREVTPADVKKMIDAKEKIIILDVRDREEFETGYIPGAINISRGMLEFRADKLMPDKNAKVIVYCGIDLRGPLATKTLNELGYRNAVNIIGGLNAWKAAGYPIEK
jgi:sulfur-carrier protein adenylyltransferase/sulfurtransferase